MQILKEKNMHSGFGVKFTVSFMMMILLVGTIAPSYSLPSDVPSNIIDNIDTELPVKQFISKQKGTPFVPNQILVGFKQDTSQESIEDFYSKFHSNYGLEEKKDLSAGNDKIPKTKLVKTTAAVNAQIIEKLQNDPRVEFVEPDYIISIDTLDTYYDLLWGLENTRQNIGGSSGTYDSDIDAPEAWQNLSSPDKVILAIIDTGVDYTHEDLAVQMWINSGEVPGNGVDDDNNGYIDDIHGIRTARGGNEGDPMDDNGHGSHTAGTIGAKGDNNKGIIGISQDVEIIACKFLDRRGSGSTSGAIECFNYLNKLKNDYGVNILVTNNSWGGGGYSPLLKIAMEGDGSILHVAAAGNSDENVDSNLHYPSSYDLSNIISVAATDFNDEYASFSNYGNDVDIAAPGVDIASTYKNNGYVWMSGTSMAAPHVTGAAALAWSANSGLSVSDVKTLIMEQGDLIPHSLGKFTGTDKRLNVNGILSQITQNISPPTNPDAPVLSSTGNTDTTIDISWTTPSDGGSSITGYTFEWSVDSFTSVLGSDVSGSNSATISGLNPTATYDIRVFATNAEGNSLNSNVATVATSDPPTNPDAPFLSSTGNTDTTIDISWTTPSDGGSSITGYTFEWSATPFTSVLGSDVSGSNSATISGLNPSATYDIRVFATNAEGNSLNSNVVTVATSDPPTNPVNVEVIAITPPTLPKDTTSFSLIINGLGFQAGAVVTLENGSGPAPQVIVQSVDTANGIISGLISTPDKGPNKLSTWDVRVTNEDGSTGILDGGFTMTPINNNKNKN